MSLISINEISTNKIPTFETEYPFISINESNQPLLDITDINPRITYDKSYYKLGYKHSLKHCYVREGVYTMLLSSLSKLDDSYSFLVYDAFRTVPAQQSLYDHCKSILILQHPNLTMSQISDMVDQFVASPTIDLVSPSPHMTGGAIDLVLCKDGIPLNMGTHFDEFSPKSYTAYYEEHCVTDDEIAFRDNRRLLYNLMISSGFHNYSHEWWHFAYGERLWSKKTGIAPIYGYYNAKNSKIVVK